MNITEYGNKITKNLNSRNRANSCYTSQQGNREYADMNTTHTVHIFICADFFK